MSTFRPFQNEEQSFNIGDLTIENRLDRIEVYGSVQITRDKTGLEHAKALKKLLDAIVSVLESAPLPDAITIKPAEVVENPFRKPPKT